MLGSKLASMAFAGAALFGAASAFLLPLHNDTCTMEGRNNGGGSYCTRCEGACDDGFGCSKATNPLTKDEKCQCGSRDADALCHEEWNAGLSPPATECGQANCNHACTKRDASDFPVGVWRTVCKC
jgi:hypothetical protein